MYIKWKKCFAVEKFKFCRCFIKIKNFHCHKSSNSSKSSKTIGIIPNIRDNK